MKNLKKEEDSFRHLETKTDFELLCLYNHRNELQPINRDKICVLMLYRGIHPTPK